MSAVAACTEWEVNAVGSEFPFEERQRRDTSSFSDVEGLDLPLVCNAVGEGGEVRALQVSEPPITHVTDVDLQGGDIGERELSDKLISVSQTH